MIRVLGQKVHGIGRLIIIGICLHNRAVRILNAKIRQEGIHVGHGHVSAQAAQGQDDHALVVQIGPQHFLLIIG